MGAEGSGRNGEARIHDAITPPVAVSLQASAEAIEDSGFPTRTSELAPLIGLLEEETADSDYLDIMHNLGILYLVGGRPQDAESLFQRCVEGNADFIEAWVNLAFTRLQLGLTEQAGTTFPRLLKNRASNAELHNLYGLFLASQGNYPGALAEYRRSLSLRPHYDLAHTNIALAYGALNEWEQALEHFSRAESLELLYRELGILREEEIQPEALERFRARVQGNPLRSTALYEAAFYYAAREEREKAIRLMGEALVIEPDFARYYTALGFLELNWGESKHAVAHLESALSIDPNSYEAHIHLGFYFGEQEQLDRVLDHFQNAVEIRPYYADLHFNLAEALLEAERHAEAIQSFRNATTINPFYTMALFKLGYAYELAGQPESALSVFNRLKSIDPEFPDVDEFIAEANSKSKPAVIERKVRRSRGASD